MFPRALPRRRLLSFALALAGATIAVADRTSALAEPTGAIRAAPPALSQAQLPPDRAAAERRRRLHAIRNWGYWLSSFEIEGIAAAPHDLLVIDNGVSANRRFQREPTPEEMVRMKRRPDGSARMLLAYLSIGEAERYRRYWRPEWHDPAKKPAWLGDENRDWAGNFAVRYWHPEWQQLIFGAPDSYLDRIMAEGFDGIYIDRADAFFYWQKEHPSAQQDMAAFLTQLSDYVRKRDPHFLIVLQNAEELLEENAVLEAIDAIAKEDLLYGVDQAETPNKPSDVTWSLKHLRLAQKAGRKVLVVEYLSDPIKTAAATKRILDEGFVPYFAPRLLNCLNPPAVPVEAGRPTDQRCR
jgi:cysteinyl-tRNA synthetase, unknown class